MGKYVKRISMEEINLTGGGKEILQAWRWQGSWRTMEENLEYLEVLIWKFYLGIVFCAFGEIWFLFYAPICCFYYFFIISNYYFYYDRELTPPLFFFGKKMTLLRFPKVTNGLKLSLFETILFLFFFKSDKLWELKKI